MLIYIFGNLKKKRLIKVFFSLLFLVSCGSRDIDTIDLNNWPLNFKLDILKESGFLIEDTGWTFEEKPPIYLLTKSNISISCDTVFVSQGSFKALYKEGEYFTEFVIYTDSINFNKALDFVESYRFEKKENISLSKKFIQYELVNNEYLYLHENLRVSLFFSFDSTSIYFRKF